MIMFALPDEMLSVKSSKTGEHRSCLEHLKGILGKDAYKAT
jgi:hypothetical protein